MLKLNHLHALGILLVIFLSINFVYFGYGTYQNDGRWIYPLDDTYIHLAVAKNFAENGVWGVTSHEFSSATSSPLYVALLAGLIWLFGAAEWWPALLNLSAGVAFLYFYYRLLSAHLKASRLLLIGIGLILFIPMHVLVLSGMEHSLHLLFSALLFALLLKVMTSQQEVRQKEIIGGILLAALCTGLRYESLFLISIACLLLMQKREFRLVAALSAGAAIPVLIYGCFSVSQGSFFLPNTLLLKGSIPGTSPNALFALMQNAYYRLFNCSIHLFVLLILAGLSARFYLERKSDHASSFLFHWSGAVVLSFAVLCQVTFAKTEFYYRYEAWLVGIGLLYITGWINHTVSHTLKSSRLMVALIVAWTLLLFFPLAKRTAGSIYRTNMAMNNIYEQQFQMARFIKEYYPQAVIGANDIGAITFFNDIKLYDFVGLATIEAARSPARRTKKFIQNLAEKKSVELIIIYDSWFRNAIPDEWIKAGEWQLADNRTCGSATVSFYAPDLTTLDHLSQNLSRFSQDKLPEGVTYRLLGPKVLAVDL